jgi:hypothetical protein
MIEAELAERLVVLLLLPVSAQRVAVSEAREPREVIIIGVELGLMFDRQCRQVRIGGEICTGSRRCEQLFKDIEMSRARIKHPHMTTSRPAAHPRQGGSGG